MATVTLTRDYSTGTPAGLSAVNYDSDREEIVAGVNSINNSQIAANAAIVGSKLDLTSLGAIGSTSASTGAFTTLAASGAVTLSGTLATNGIVTASKAVNITIANTGNDVALEVTQSDVTNNPVAASITNAGTGNGLFIDQNGNGIALNIDTEATMTYAAYIATITTTSSAVRIFHDGALTGAGSSVFLVQSNNASTSRPCATFQQVGTGNGLFIDQDGNGIALEIDSEVADAGYLLHATTAAQAHAFAFTREDSITNGCAIILASNFIWVDATGDLRIKTSRPTSDTDGSIVGTQS